MKQKRPTMGAVTRRLQNAPGGRLSQIEQSLEALKELPMDQQKQYGPALVKAKEMEMQRIKGGQ